MPGKFRSTFLHQLDDYEWQFPVDWEHPSVYICTNAGHHDAISVKLPSQIGKLFGHMRSQRIRRFRNACPITFKRHAPRTSILNMIQRSLRVLNNTESYPGK